MTLITEIYGVKGEMGMLKLNLSSALIILMKITNLLYLLYFLPIR